MGALVLAGCEGTVGPAGPQGAQGEPGTGVPVGGSSTDLADYGFTFGTLVHTIQGRGAVYSAKITGVALTGVTSDATALSSVPTTITITYGTKSVRFSVSSTATPAALKDAFDAAKGYIGGSGLTMALVGDPKGGASNKFIQVSGIDPTKEFTIVGTTGTGFAVKIFGNASTVHGVTVTANSVSNLEIVSGLTNTWTIPVITELVATGLDASSAPATVHLGGGEVYIPQASDATEISDAVSALDDVFAGYTVTDGTGYIIVTADDVGPGTLTSDQLKPTLSGFDLKPWGYLVDFEHTTVGVLAVTETVSAVKQKYTSATAATFTANKRITIKLPDGTWDTSIFTASSDTTTDNTALNALFNTTLTGSAFGTKTLTNGVVVLVADEAGPSTFTVEGDFTIGDAGDQATGRLSNEVTGVKDEWTLRVIGGGATSDLIPTVASKVAFTGATAGVDALIPAGTAGSDIFDLIRPALAGVTVTGYGYTQGTGVYLLTAASGVSSFTAPAPTITSLY